jgi:hypothetical protein
MKRASYYAVLTFDMPDSGLTSLWSATLLAALTAGKTVQINGTVGPCNAYGEEVVSNIGALP